MRPMDPWTRERMRPARVIESPGRNRYPAETCLLPAVTFGSARRPIAATRVLYGLVMALIVAAGDRAPAHAAIDMSGNYNAIEFSCHYTIVQTGSDLQVSGGCGTNPLSLTGTIDPATGQFSVSGPLAGNCGTLGLIGTADGEEFHAAFTCDSFSGIVTGTKCLNGVIDPGEDCQDGNVADGDCCSSRCRAEPAGSACAPDQNACTDDVCDGAGTCTHAANTAQCDDGNACTTGEVCSGGSCVPGQPIAARACTARHACERAAAHVVSSCIARVAARTKSCYLATGAPCPADDPWTVKALTKVADRIGARCSAAELVRDNGYGTAATPAALVARIQEVCTGEVASIAARTFGGPQGALLAGADNSTTRCLANASATAVRLVNREVKLRAACLAEEHGASTPCDVADTTARIAVEESKAADAIAASCSDLQATVGLDAATYVAHAASQARCITAATHGHTDPLDLDCGARDSVPVPQRGVWTRVILDEASFGSRCGDGSPYAFWLRLAPAGSPAEKLIIDLQGGGYCGFDFDCSGKPADLFSAMDDNHPTTGIVSTSVADNPFADWTMVFLPYCTQDLHAGGGVTQMLSSRNISRYGAVNVRAALRYVRDVLWRDLAATEPEGYRPDRLAVVFTGLSSGGTGVNYNYHYLLDDLRWAHTTAVPDSGFTLDNGQSFGVLALAPVLQTAWGTRPSQAPYCLDPSCALTPILQAASVPRLKAVPEQQILNLANQADGEQPANNLFANTTDWINAVRSAYCANQGLPGIRNWLSAQSTPAHTILEDPVRWATVTAGGEPVRVFLADAMAEPDAVTDHVDEGTLVADYPGVNPIACLP